MHCFPCGGDQGIPKQLDITIDLLLLVVSLLVGVSVMVSTLSVVAIVVGGATVSKLKTFTTIVSLFQYL